MRRRVMGRNDKLIHLEDGACLLQTFGASEPSLVYLVHSGAFCLDAAYLFLFWQRARVH
jgi:hypothetical protein